MSATNDVATERLLDKKLGELFDQLDLTEPKRRASNDQLSVICSAGFLGGGDTKICRRAKATRLLRPIIIDGLGMQYVCKETFCAMTMERYIVMKTGKAHSSEYAHSRLNMGILLKALFHFISKGHKAVVWLPSIYNPIAMARDRMMKKLIIMPELLKFLHKRGLVRFFSDDSFAPLIEEVLDTDALLCTRAKGWDLSESREYRNQVMVDMMTNTANIGLIDDDLLDRFVEPAYSRHEQTFLTTAFCSSKSREIPQGMYVREHPEGSDLYAKLLEEQLALNVQVEYVQLLHELFQKLALRVTYVEMTTFQRLTEYFYEHQSNGC
ncbi:hypothetical protein QR680_006912 [Steinernema hermaphroditum]|uniref:Uncharacterized protein n=1 Tax=Steinernema hermaphroditum TaxID=289476 RepID=A0AA39HWY6_9BILA|nr:hypothetical protein QR680_006912 [Steinernema hermaphroditum]